MITEHALDRYIERIKGNPSGIGRLERLELYKELSKIAGEIDVFYEGNFYGSHPVKRFMVRSDMIFIIADHKIVTMWKATDYKRSDIANINKYKNLLDRKIKQKKKLEIENKRLDDIVNFIVLSNLKRGLVKTMAEQEDVKIKTTILKKEITALELIITTECYNFIYKDIIKEKWEPLDFYLDCIGEYKERRIQELKDGLNYLKEEQL